MINILYHIVHSCSISEIILTSSLSLYNNTISLMSTTERKYLKLRSIRIASLLWQCKRWFFFRLIKWNLPEQKVHFYTLSDDSLLFCNKCEKYTETGGQGKTHRYSSNIRSGSFCQQKYYQPASLLVEGREKVYINNYDLSPLFI